MTNGLEPCVIDGSSNGDATKTFGGLYMFLEILFIISYHRSYVVLYFIRTCHGTAGNSIPPPYLLIEGGEGGFGGPSPVTDVNSN